MPLVLPGSTIFVLLLAIFALLGWPMVARGVRAIVLVERDREYAVAARAAGASPTRLLTRHLLPAASGYLSTQATLLLPAFILAESTMSYVGLGFPDTHADLGHDAAGCVERRACSAMRRGRSRLRPRSSWSCSA